MIEKNLKKYSFDDVRKETLKYFNGDELATDVWIRKYCLKSENTYHELNPHDMHRRIAKELSRIENKYPNPISEEEIYETLKYFKRIVPQGSPMSGIGNDLQIVSLSNCFVVGNERDSDSYGGIMKLDQEIVQLQKRRGGVGLDLSFVRPAGSPVKNSAITSTGVVPFMERFSNSTKEVAQDGRRGALMESISIKHPDAESFIDAKLTDGKVTGANVSIKITNEFMNAVIEDKPFIQQYPIDSANPTYTKVINAKKLWQKIIHNAWKSAEPGILFWDTIINESIPDCYADLGFKTTSTNPCVSEDTMVLTDKGQFKIIDILNQKVNVWNGKNFTEVTPQITGYNQKMIKITFSDGSELKCTPYHGFYVWDGYYCNSNLIKKDAKDLVINDRLERYVLPSLIKDDGLNLDREFYTLGFFAGDNFFLRDKENKIQMLLHGERKNLVNKLNVTDIILDDNENDVMFVRIELPHTDLDLSILKKYVPKYQNNSPSSIMSWLVGILDSDSTYDSTEGSISISSTDREFLNEIKLHILNFIGIGGKIINKSECDLNKNSEYCLVINECDVIKLYELGLRTHYPEINDNIFEYDKYEFITVKSIETIEDAEKVYCFTESERGRGCFNGIVTANCGEIPLCPDDSCRLLALNLYGYIVNPFQSNSYFNWELFKSDVIKAQRYMDDIIDLENEKIDAILEKINSDPEDEFIKQYEIRLWERIKHKTLSGRRTGLGITAEGDMIAALGMIYGTDEANDFSERIHKTLKLEAYRSSIIMAKERGTFPIYNVEREINNPFIERIKFEDIELYTLMQKYGRRNIALLTIAPTGCSDKESMITTDDGFFKLSELCNANETGFHALNRHINVIQDNSINKSTKGFNNGYSKTKKIITDSGIELESTYNHQYKIITKDGNYSWKRVDEMAIGDMIVSRIGGYNKEINPELLQFEFEDNISNGKIKLPKYLDDDFAKFLGILYANGSMSSEGIKIHYDCNCEYYIKIKNLIKKIFEYDIESCNEEQCKTIYIQSNILVRFLMINNLFTEKMDDIEIPLLIRMSSKKSIESFVNGYWFTCKNEINNYKYINTKSKKIAQQLAVIIRGIGKNVKIESHINEDEITYRIYENEFGSVGFVDDGYISNDNKNWLRLVRNFGDELFFDEIIDIIDSETETLDIEVPNKNMYLLNSSVSHNTVSLMTQTTSGIEPVFLPVYKRRRKINPNDKDVRIDFIDHEAIAWQEYPVFHHKFETWLDMSGYDLKIVKSMTYDQVQEIVKKSPYYKATSNDVNWVKKVEMQGRIQKHIDHSISVTVNLPEDISEEIVAKVYESGWEVGCKGITVYRDGSRNGVLISNSEKKEKEKSEIFQDTHAPKRPKRLKADVIRFQNNLEKWIAVVGLLDGRPYEIFTGRLENGLANLPISIKECEVVKNIIENDSFDEIGKPIKIRKKRYDIEYVDGNGDKQILSGLNHTFNPEYWNYAKLMSSVLRHGMPMEYVYELISGLNLNDIHLNTWKNGVARMIKRYIRDGAKGKGKCPECGGENLQFKEGCLICIDCGNGRCG